MTKKLENKWEEISLILQQKRADTLREIKTNIKNGADTLSTGDQIGDTCDQASSERDRELILLLGDREREKLNAIDEALMRIKEEEYGICEECEEEIPLGRLKAMPFTRHCVNCKSELEKHQALTGQSEEDRGFREMAVGNEVEDV